MNHICGGRILSILFIFFVAGPLEAQLKPTSVKPTSVKPTSVKPTSVKPAIGTKGTPVVIANKLPSGNTLLDGTKVLDESPPQPEDSYPMPNLKLTKINGPPDNIEDVKIQIKSEIYSVTKAFFAALEKERNLKFDPALVNETAAAYYKSIQSIDRFGPLKSRYESGVFRGFLIRRTSKLFQNSFAAKFDEVYNSISSQNKLLSEKITVLEKKLNSPNDMIRSPRSIYDIFSIVAFLASLGGLYLVFVRTY